MWVAVILDANGATRDQIFLKVRVSSTFHSSSPQKTIILLYLELQYLVERRDPFAKLVEGMRTASPFLQMQAYRAIMERSTSIVIKRLSRILEVNLALLSHAPSPQHRLM